jgi:glycerol-3-phosphate acyltransferase PlsY
VPAAVAVLVFAAVAFATRYIALASVAAAMSLPWALASIAPSGSRALAALAIALLIAWRHRENFARMRAGTEPRFGETSPERWGL